MPWSPGWVDVETVVEMAKTGAARAQWLRVRCGSPGALCPERTSMSDGNIKSGGSFDSGVHTGPPSFVPGFAGSCL